MNRHLLKYILLFVFPVVVQAQVFERSLSSEKWKFRKVSETYWMSATVPGTVHTDLLSNKRISDPFYGDNEMYLMWIENHDWEYTTTFSISKTEIIQSHIELQFEGLDTYAKVFVNDSLVLIADNMFRSWKVDVKKYIRKGKNELNIVFESAVKKGKEEAKKLSYTLPGDEKVFTRKAQYQYGWDWGPRFVTCGIWKDLKLVCWKDARILNLKSIQKSLSDSLAQLEFVCEIESDVDANAYLDIANVAEDNAGQTTTKIALQKGIHSYDLAYTLKNPQLWWCNGLGFPTMYNFKIQLSYDSRFLDAENFKIGLRTIELIQDKDSIGKSFYFKLNGVPVFMKGANYIPPDNFLPRVKKEHYKTILDNAVDANMNMLRVWGGGVYADDAFYEACDNNGILVWQDFMFACAMYPGDNHFVNNVAEEIIDQVKRLRNHPSIALWCGNNEVDEGWKNWGWQKQYKYTKEDSTTIAQNNFALFDNFIKDLVTIHDGSRAYWPSSPSIGWGHKESLQEGDSHYWGVWWGMEPFENYEKKVGRFVSEYGFQGMPSLSTFKKMGVLQYNGGFEYIPGSCSHLRIDSLAFNTHQKHPKGYQTIRSYMERDFKIPNCFDNYVYVSQLLQAKGMKTGIEAHRRAKPYCMGTLYWQLNDCWPVTSWSSIDYNNEWKASHYQVKRSYKNVIVSVEEKKDSCNIYVVSDLTKNESGELTMDLFDLSGKLLISKTIAGNIAANASQIFCRFDKALIKKYNVNDLVLRCSLKSANNSISDAHCAYYFADVKNLNLQRPNISVNFDYCEQVQCFTIETDVPAKNVFLSVLGESVNLSDNYFDLLPGERKVIYLPRGSNVKKIKNKIVVKSLIDTY